VFQGINICKYGVACPNLTSSTLLGLKHQTSQKGANTLAYLPGASVTPCLHFDKNQAMLLAFKEQNFFNLKATSLAQFSP
jgi:hypothetical protein